jgi:hypothetical protein
MSSPDWPKDDPLDILLERRLKSFAQRSSPPAKTRSELLFKAAMQEMVSVFDIPLFGFFTSGRDIDVHRRRDALDTQLLYTLHFSPARMIL